MVKFVYDEKNFYGKLTDDDGRDMSKEMLIRKMMLVYEAGEIPVLTIECIPTKLEIDMGDSQ